MMFGCNACCFADENKEDLDSANAGIQQIDEDFCLDTSAVAEKVSEPTAPLAHEDNSAILQKAIHTASQEELKLFLCKLGSSDISKIRAIAGVPTLPSTPQLPKKHQFNITVKKSAGSDLGLSVDRSDQMTLKVLEVRRPGLIQNWNENNAAQQVVAGDRILAVNDVAGSTEQMLKQLSETTLKLTIEKANEIMVSFEKDKADAEMGIKLSLAEGKILEINDGLLMNYNKNLPQDHASFALKVGDKVIEANGVKMPGGIIKELMCTSALDLVFLREQ